MMKDERRAPDFIFTVETNLLPIVGVDILYAICVFCFHNLQFNDTHFVMYSRRTTTPLLLPEIYVEIFIIFISVMLFVYTQIVLTQEINGMY